MSAAAHHAAALETAEEAVAVGEAAAAAHDAACAAVAEAVGRAVDGTSLSPGISPASPLHLTCISVASRQVGRAFAASQAEWLHHVFGAWRTHVSSEAMRRLEASRLSELDTSIASFSRLDAELRCVHAWHACA